jgi:hypothetical protein
MRSIPNIRIKTPKATMSQPTSLEGGSYSASLALQVVILHPGESTIAMKYSSKLGNGQPQNPAATLPCPAAMPTASSSRIRGGRPARRRRAQLIGVLFQATVMGRRFRRSFTLRSSRSSWSFCSWPKQRVRDRGQAELRAPLDARMRTRGRLLARPYGGQDREEYDHEQATQQDLKSRTIPNGKVHHEQQRGRRGQDTRGIDGADSRYREDDSSVVRPGNPPPGRVVSLGMSKPNCQKGVEDPTR